VSADMREGEVLSEVHCVLVFFGWGGFSQRRYS
jgi:hypothetical protein